MGVFDLIAPVYGLFFGFQAGMFRRNLAKAASLFHPAQGESVLDVGCGTGALVSVLAEMGIHATGVDPSPGMLRIARKKAPAGAFVEGNVLGGLPWPDGSFDHVVSSFVAHGLSKDGRNRMFAECRRLARKSVSFIEYNEVRRPLSDFLEWAEGGDYFRFIRTAPAEMQLAFGGVKILPLEKQTAFYYCPCN